MSPRVTTRDVAHEAGVSVTTVSQALNSPEGSRVSETTREHVKDVAARLGYRANTSARALRTRRTDTIALVGRDLVTTEFLGGLIRGAQEEVRRHGGILIVADTGDDGEGVVRTLRDHQVDGVILGAFYHQQIDVPAALEGVPTVVVNAFTQDPDSSWVVPDEVRGGRDAAEVLLAAGHRRVAMIGNRDDIPAAHGRRQGFEARCREAGVEPVVIEIEPTAEAARIATTGLLTGPDRPTGLFAFNDAMAIGVYFAASALGLRIPEDLSVVGFDAMRLIDVSLSPVLTSVALPHAEMAAWAVERLYEVMTPGGHERRHERLVGRVVEGASVAAPARA